MKKVILLILILCLFASPVWIGAVDLQAEEGEELALVVRDLLGGDKYEELIRKEYPKAKINWGSRVVSGQGATYLIYCEITHKDTSNYIYYELKLTSINDNPELAKAYGILVE